MAVAMILSFYRKIIQNHNDIKNNIWSKYSGETLLNKKIGIIGLGNIGKKIIQMLQGFETTCYGNDLKKINKKFINRYNLRIKNKRFIFQNCNIIIIATDLNRTSYKLLNKKTFKQLKMKPLIVNIGRGGSIDSMALLEALKKKRIIGACLDVFENEPLQKNSRLRKFENCIFTSHNAFNTKDEVEFVHRNTINNIFKGLNLDVKNTQKI